MRGRTLNRAVIILDEAQNTTRTQMKMFLTRMGHGSKMIVTGDPTQIDLPDPAQNGLIDAARVLKRVRGIGWVTFGESDIVRHDLVQRVVEAYGASEKAGKTAKPGGRVADLSMDGGRMGPEGEPLSDADADGEIESRR
jgi:phosphate starvation-inducible PhoH-like protein